MWHKLHSCFSLSIFLEPEAACSQLQRRASELSCNCTIGEVLKPG